MPRIVKLNFNFGTILRLNQTIFDGIRFSRNSVSSIFHQFKISVQVEVKSMSNELFVELNDEQQEIVAGGAASLTSLSITAFDKQAVSGGTASMSGPGGSMTASHGGAVDTTTFGLSLLAIQAG
jgi:hypothetical protein